MSKLVADVIVEALMEAGAKRCYGIVGDTLNFVTDAIRRKGMEWIHVRHEEVAGFAAGADAFMTDELAVCAGSAGPGSLHFVNGLFESHRNGAPVVMIASQIDRIQSGLAFPQDVDQKKIYEQYSVFCEYISHPDQARRITVQAAQAALTKRGVAVIIVNGDMTKERTKDETHWTVSRPSPVIRPNDDELAQLADLVNTANKITIYGGIGCRHAHDAVVALAAKLKAPVAHTSRAKEFLEHDNPYNVSMTGLIGTKSGFEAVEHCDLLLCLGTDFAWPQFYPRRAKIVQIDIDPAHIGRRTPVTLGLVGDVNATIAALLPLLDERSDDAFLAASLKEHEKSQKTLEEQARERSPGLIHPQYVATKLNELADDDAIFTSEGGTTFVWMLRYLHANGKRRFLTSLLHGTMANSYPMAIGCQKSHPGRQVVAMCGDGGMTMLMGDLLTLVQEKLPVKLVVFNNGSLGFVEMEMKVEGMLDAFTDLHNPDFSALAKACGFYGRRVENADDLEPAMTEWLSQDGPALLDVVVNRMELVMPPTVEVGQAVSTAMYGVKAVLDGRLNDVWALAVNNTVK
ncbi:thiamine pyrophosphate-dependent enzyme [Microbaculum marinisediminis]|uniref:Thiamine pyrophosphate-binding protein n=1 Tax=Microbaculum marinisediminis TaxID=2931392 RepID=A0AAW5R1F0_9HYPH|nr:thiamine pyrophosphate-dependent enzyme [Microbaculum sp. A6E488]MCT8972350.1 thiamine pyrophosphate-binding protein [Microbaculum sp. A6E488]